ncbi:Hypothetical_protein [Hexamita inflata]|uniref:Hypothetical_protein n=1 Tax=Hexamita inflata TaxID=28002 RepID=A0AA86NXY3_9EUKA|nr:Hypothetical protein HINF_LOCUS14810 [Hexamita inflata]
MNNDCYIIQGIASLLNLNYQSDSENQIVVQVLALPSQLLTQLFAQLSFELNVEYNSLINYFNNNIAPKHKTFAPKFKFTQHRTQPEQQVLFNNQFSDALKTVLQNILNINIQFTSNAHLCQCVNEYFSTKGQANFWVKMSKLIPQKNERQLREYYQKSFQRCMYLESITEPDKALLCKLIDQMPQSKPAVIADQFTKMVGTEKYFKRNVVMYVVNRRQK